MIGLQCKTSRKQVLVEFPHAKCYVQGFFFNHGIIPLTWRQTARCKSDWPFFLMYCNVIIPLPDQTTMHQLANSPLSRDHNEAIMVQISGYPSIFEKFHGTGSTISTMTSPAATDLKDAQGLPYRE